MTGSVATLGPGASQALLLGLLIPAGVLAIFLIFFWFRIARVRIPRVVQTEHETRVRKRIKIKGGGKRGGSTDSDVESGITTTTSASEGKSASEGTRTTTVSVRSLSGSETESESDGGSEKGAEFFDRGSSQVLPMDKI
ncbi:hypothetical protein BDZ91DRAFT_750710 [Kalaharituber pfeilii]|nr:hypothetical protein BDZ91DRAFT_750710 [Kalaharituber pfeilii]